MISTAIVTAVFTGTPALVLWLCRRSRVLGKIGPVLILYILGLIFGNIWHPHGMSAVQGIFSNAAVPLAIPLLLFGCTFRKNGTASQIKALFSGVLAVILAVVAGYLLFGRRIADGAVVGGMLTGVYTGGTMNLAALKAMLGASDETFILLNSYDLVISFLYLAFLLSFGIKLFRKVLPCESSVYEFDGCGEMGRKRGGWKDIALVLAADLVIIALSYAAGKLAGDEWFMTVFILLLTTLGIAASFIKSVQESSHSEGIGMYLIYIFSMVVASMADFSNIDLQGGAYLLGYLTFVVFGSLMIQLLLAYLLRADADTTVISSVSFICSPPFVPMVSAAMGNRKVLAAGLAIGVIGYAAGNYIGFLLSSLLKLL